ncbi:MAG TPA: HAD family phosphatase [Aggregatilineaceae bacterium]|nr:HAD family phosphatase [Aggregatilineaceae bacterium]
MIQAVIFDMDGLLVDSEPLWARARIEAFGMDQLRWTETDQQNIMGNSAQGWGEYLEKRLDYRYSVSEIIELVVAQMEQFYFDAVPLLPGAREVIQLLRPHYRLGVASGSSQRLIRAVIQSADWTDVFEKIVSSDEVAHGKPAPDTYLEAIRQMNVPGAQTAIFEDSANGILSGLAAGVKVIAVPNAEYRPSADVLRKAHRVIPSLNDFSLDMLRNL